MTDYPQNILEALRQRRGLAEDDSSEDVFIRRMSAERALEEKVAWHLGDGAWATVILEWAKECGYKIVEPKN